MSAAPGLDLAVLVDCSGSMDRHRGNEVVLLRMTADLLVRNGEANRVEHRMAVIRFGSSASVDVPFTSARQVRPRLNALSYEDRGETNVLAAFVEAEQLFRSLPASPERRRAILLVTDGVPYVRGGDMPSYRDSLRRFAAAHFAERGITIDVLLIDSRYDVLWRQLARVEPVGGTSDQLLASAHGVVTRLAGTQTAESARAKSNPSVDTLTVPPYLDVIVFDVLRLSAAVTVEIFPPGSAAPIRSGTGGIESIRIGDVLTTLVVPRPRPGEWVIRKSHQDARVRILSQQFFPRGLLLRPAPTETLRQCDRVPIVYRVLDGSGRPFEELPDYALALDLTVAMPGGAITTVAMERDPSLGVCAFRSARELECDLPGRYWTDVRITTVAGDGHRLDVFRDRWSGFSVVAGPGKECTGRVAEARAVADAPTLSGKTVAAVLTVAAAIAAWMGFRRTKA